MSNLQMKYETMIRQIFQCGRLDDPLGRLANTDAWYGLHDNEFSKSHVCKAWAVLSRLKLQYLHSVTGREEFYQEVSELEDDILNATSNNEIINVMNRLTEIVEELNLSEYPHISYKATNDFNK